MPTKKVAIGTFVLPTATRFHMQDLDRSSAATQNQYCYLLEAIASGEGGYPAQVVLTSNVDLKWDIDTIVDTQHAEVRKQLPQRRVLGIILPHGEEDGILPAEGGGLPHWEHIPANEKGAPDAAAVVAAKIRVIRRRQQIEDAKTPRKAS